LWIGRPQRLWTQAFVGILPAHARDALQARPGLAVGLFDKAVIPRLLAVFARQDEVIAWRKTKLTDKQRLEWSHPNTIFEQCPIFREGRPAGERSMTYAEKLRLSLIALEEENHQLRQRQDGDRFKPTDTAEDVATVLVGMFSASKAEKIARAMLVKLKER
jgi:hypothetical protein